MKTIKDRADAYREQFLKSFWKSLQEEISFYDISDAYVAGAKEQEEVTKQKLILKSKKAFCSATCTVCENCTENGRKCKQYKNFVKLLKE